MTEYYCEKDGILKRTLVCDIYDFDYCKSLKRNQSCVDCENIREI